MMYNSPTDGAITLTAARKFHNIFTVPATDTRGPLKVTFALAGAEEEESPTLFFIGGMFGTRWQAVFQDFIAKQKGIRVLFVDRPGFGGSTPVPIANRLSVFLEVIPILLAHLKIKHIHIAAQSAGTIYGYNLLSHYPDLLYPNNPGITFFSPWVHQSISSNTGLALAAMLPNNMLNGWNKIVGFVVNTAQPAFSSSSGIFTAVTSAFKTPLVPTTEEIEEEEMKCAERYGIDLAAKEETDKLVFKYAFAEDSTGANDEARMCMKSASGTYWGACESYEDCIKNLAEVWEQRVQNGSKQLRVNVVLPEEDSMVGEKGMQYFEDIWAQDKCGAGIDVRVERMEGTDHDTTANAQESFLGRLFDSMRSGTNIV